MGDPQAPRNAAIGPGRAGRHPLLAGALAPLLAVLVTLMYYFATRVPGSDWVMVIALGICATAVAARLTSLLLALRRK